MALFAKVITLSDALMKRLMCIVYEYTLEDVDKSVRYYAYDTPFHNPSCYFLQPPCVFYYGVVRENRVLQEYKGTHTYAGFLRGVIILV
jgi:hypothetical protein